MVLSPSTEQLRTRRRAVTAGFVQMLRPLFTRWAGHQVREVFKLIATRVWCFDDQPGVSWLDIAHEVETLPEAEFDDSNHRDYYVMLGLGVLYYGALVLGDVERANDSQKNWQALNSTIDNFMRQCHVLEGLDHFLRGCASIDETVGLRVGADRIRSLADEAAAGVDHALDEIADRRGWARDREPGLW